MPDPGSEIPFTPVVRAGEIASGCGHTVEIAGRLIAVLFDGENYFALDDLCPHMGASLGAGPFSEGVVTCPWHAWRFRACDGAWCDDESVRVAVYPVRVRAGMVEVQVPGSDPRAPPAPI